MFFTFDMTVPANTAESAPLTLDVQLPPGIVQQVDVEFPSGCVGLVHTLCRRATHQVWPTNDSSNLHSNGRTITWPDDYELDAAPFGFRLFAWSEDDTFEHVITWRFGVRAFPAGSDQQLAAERAAAAVQTLEVEV